MRDKNKPFIRRVLLLACGLLLLMIDAAQASGLYGNCRIIFFDKHSGRYTILVPDTGKTQIVETGRNPFTSEDTVWSNISYQMLAPDQRTLAVTMGDTGVEIEGLGERPGTKLFRVSPQGATYIHTITALFASRWSHRGDKLLLRNILDTNEGFYYLYDMPSGTLTESPQRTNELIRTIPNTPPPYLTLNVYDLAWSLDDRYIAFMANEHPFPQDEYGENWGLYIAPLGGKAVQISDRKAEVEFHGWGWLPGNRIAFTSCIEDKCQWIVSSADGKQKQILKEGRVIGTWNSAGDKFLCASCGSSEVGMDGHIYFTLSIYDLTTDQFTNVDQILDEDAVNFSTPLYQWSPDGGTIVYPKTINGKVQWYVYDFRENKVRTLDVPMNDPYTPGDWSPDSKKLLFGPSEGETIFRVYDVESRTVNFITAPKPSNPDWRTAPSWVCPK